MHRGRPFYDRLTDFMSAGRICAMELVAPGAIRKWRELIGPTDSERVGWRPGEGTSGGIGPGLGSPRERGFHGQGVQARLARGW